MKKYAQFQGKRTKSGSAINEMAPALFLLFFFAVFPMLNLIFLGLIFASCAMLNNLEVSEASRTPNSQLTASIATLQTDWQNTGWGRLSVGSATPSYNVTYITIGTDAYVCVGTTFTVKPFMSLPFFNGVPGLGAPWSFTVFGKRVLENSRYANS